MEDTLEVYHRPYDPTHPVVCLDEKSKTLHSTPRGTVPAEPGRPELEDYEYERKGTCNTFLAVEPLTGKCRVDVTDRRTAIDFADEMKLLVDRDYPDAEKILLVTDNLNTHSKASLYDRFLPEEALRISQKIEFHFTPEHGSWLNMAECALSALSRQCLNRRFSTREEIEIAVAAWQTERNNANIKINWQFTTADARIKLRRLYPEIVNSS